MPTATVNDIQLAYVEQGRGQPVVFVHGGLGDYRHFAGQMAAFAERHRAIAVSCRGYWPNEPLRPDEEITLDTFVEDLAGVHHVAGRRSRPPHRSLFPWRFREPAPRPAPSRSCCGRWSCSSRRRSRCSASTSRPLRRS